MAGSRAPTGIRLLCAALTALAMLMGCGRGAPPGGRTELLVFAAASLGAALRDLGTTFTAAHPGTVLLFNFASSRLLQMQIEQGAACDVFLSAARGQMDALQEQGLLVRETRAAVVRNALVVATRRDAAVTIAHPQDLGAPSITRIGIGTPGVPVGDYARECLTSLGILGAVADRLVPLQDEPAVLTAVASGEVDIGLVYRSSCVGGPARDRLQVVWTPPEASHSPIEYPMAVLKSSAHPDAARALIAWLRSDAAAALWEAAGFIPGTP